MKRLSYIIVMVFVLALVAQWAVMAAAKTAAPPAKAPAKAAVQVVKADVSDTMIMLNPTTAKAGKVRIEFKNTGKKPHDLEIKGNGMTKKVPKIEAGKTRQMTMDLKAGKYKIYDPKDKKIKAATLDIK